MQAEAVQFQPYREPLRTTLLRTGAIAVAIGAVIAIASHGGMSHLPAATLIALWPAFGGHWLELWFLNWLRPRLPATRSVQIAARLVTWFVGGVVFALGMYVTAIVVIGPRPMHWPALVVAGVAFIGIELIVHLVLQLRGRPSFYNGRG
jgi:hypothetical protein